MLNSGLCTDTSICIHIHIHTMNMYTHTDIDIDVLLKIYLTIFQVSMILIRLDIFPSHYASSYFCSVLQTFNFFCTIVCRNNLKDVIISSTRENLSLIWHVALRITNWVHSILISETENSSQMQLQKCMPSQFSLFLTFNSLGLNTNVVGEHQPPSLQ